MSDIERQMRENNRAAEKEQRRANGATVNPNATAGAGRGSRSAWGMQPRGLDSLQQTNTNATQESNRSGAFGVTAQQRQAKSDNISQRQALFTEMGKAKPADRANFQGRAAALGVEQKGWDSALSNLSMGGTKPAITGPVAPTSANIAPVTPAPVKEQSELSKMAQGLGEANKSLNSLRPSLGAGSVYSKPQSTNTPTPQTGPMATNIAAETLAKPSASSPMTSNPAAPSWTQMTQLSPSRGLTTAPAAALAQNAPAPPVAPAQPAATPAATPAAAPASSLPTQASQPQTPQERLNPLMGVNAANVVRQGISDAAGRGAGRFAATGASIAADSRNTATAAERAGKLANWADVTKNTTSTSSPARATYKAVAATQAKNAADLTNKAASLKRSSDIVKTAGKPLSWVQNATRLGNVGSRLAPIAAGARIAAKGAGPIQLALSGMEATRLASDDSYRNAAVANFDERAESGLGALMRGNVVNPVAASMYYSKRGGEMIDGTITNEMNAAESDRAISNMDRANSAGAGAVAQNPNYQNLTAKQKADIANEEAKKVRNKPKEQSATSYRKKEEFSLRR
jgi:hypothetical protein